MFSLFKKKLDITYGYDDVTLIPQYSELDSRISTDVSMNGYYLPIIGSCMSTLGIDMMKTLSLSNIPFVCHRAFKTGEQQFNYFFPNDSFEKLDYRSANCIWFAIGSVKKYQDWIDFLLSKGVRRFCVDMAHGDSEACISTIKYLKEELNHLEKSSKTKIQTSHIIAGNVATVEGFKRLQKAGADGIRVGIASGQICSTAIQTGFGVPILTNIMQIAKHKKNTWLIADGGCKQTGNIAKAIYFGADFVMIGKMLASTDLGTGACFNSEKQKLVKVDEIVNPQDNFACVYPDQLQQKFQLAKKLDSEYSKDNYFQKLCLKNVVKYKTYYGMSSRVARKGVLSYNSVQGVMGLTAYTSKTNDFIRDTKLRLHSALGYGGAKNWDQFRKKVKACMRSNAGIIAADTHLQVTFDK